MPERGHALPGCGLAAGRRGNETITALRLVRRIAARVAFLDPVSDQLQGAVRALPRRLRDVLDGVWLGAPLHPALTDVPLGSWSAATLLDAAGLVADDEGPQGAADAALAVGVLAALPAALTGLNDWSHLRGDSKRIGTLHALLNSTSLTLNIASKVFRRRGARGRAQALSTLAYGGALVSAHLGGLLSFGLGVRVNRTAFEAPTREWTDVLGESELRDEALRRVDVGGAPVLVARSGSGTICALAARCSHLGGPLEDGERRGDVVTCPWHGSRFDLCSGRVVSAPSVFSQPVYEARVVDGRIELRSGADG